MNVGIEDLWTSLPVPAVLIGPQDTILTANTAAEGFFNVSAKAMIGSRVWDVIAIDAPIDESFAHARAHATPLFVNDIGVGGGRRSSMQCMVQIGPVQGQKGHMIMLIAPRDLAEHMTQNQSVDAAAKSAIGMAQMLAHEIKNPLAGITGAAQLLSMNLNKGDLELTELIVAESRRIVKLLDQVEHFGNLSPPDLSPINVHDVLERTRRSALVGFGAHMRIAEHYDPSLPLAHGDPDQLLQVFLNLVKNAAEAAPKEGGTIWLRTYFEHSYRLRRAGGKGQALPLQVEVIDDGPGLPEAIKADIFDPFVSGKENGTGLGLALVGKIVTDHSGWISVRSVPGRTVFRVSLPRAPQYLDRVVLSSQEKE